MSQGLPSFPMSTQASYVPISAMPYGFTPMPSFPVFNSNNGMTGFYAGRGIGRFHNNAGRGNNFGGRANGMNLTAAGNQNGGFRNIGNNNAGGGNPITCQWCNKVGHSAKTCRSLPLTQQDSNQAGCQYCGKPGHTADRCYFIIGFPGQQNDSEDSNATAMVAAATNLAPQFWLADTSATNHMTNNLQLLNNVFPYPNTDGVQIGQGAGQDIIPGTE